LPKIDFVMVRRWVEDLDLTKRSCVFVSKKVFLKRFLRKSFLSTGLLRPRLIKRLGGYIGETVVSIKPMSCKTKNVLVEKIEAKMIYCEKLKTE
jgi:hypothetical protein